MAIDPAKNSDIVSHPFPQKNAKMDGAPRQYLVAGSINRLRKKAKIGGL
jgi:hypothetical protein